MYTMHTIMKSEYVVKGMAIFAAFKTLPLIKHDFNCISYQKLKASVARMRFKKLDAY